MARWLPGEPPSFLYGLERTMKLSHVGMVALLLVSVGTVSAIATTPRTHTPQPVESPTHPIRVSATCLGDVHGELVVLNCRDTKAQYEVLGKVERITEDFDAKVVCAEWPGSTGAIWSGSKGGVGGVTCVRNVVR